MAKKKSTEKQSEGKYSFVENENGKYPSSGQVEKYGLDESKKYILTKK